MDKRLQKSLEKFQADYEKAVAEYWGEENRPWSLAEDSSTYYMIKDMKITSRQVTWTTIYTDYEDTTYHEKESDSEELREWLKKWRADARRAKRYWESENPDKLDDDDEDDED